jgi:hypothetical protein
MTSAGRKTIATVALYTCAFCSAAASQGESDVSNREPAPIQEEVVVRGTSPGELRLQIELAEEAVFARFNEINSDDRFDIVCRSELLIGSRIPRRVCRSNSWREQDASHSFALIQEMQGSSGPNARQFLFEQERMQRLLAEEMRRLVYEDDRLHRTIEQLAGAKLAYAERSNSPMPWSVSRQVMPSERGLPYGAQTMVEVQIGRDRWAHRLSQPTFEVAHVAGTIQRLEIVCDQGRERHNYEQELAWTLPAGWTGCTLWVDAKRDTTFTLYEFE